ncbi:4-hydroxythreonine-4-phosphate dehydrogenase PdxA [Zooshikella harenae]|uniref:4-hydroxythreonine-4-phosphate dehydrogenase n=1 Tax=Zooshikella harenae TaxID=2827238 RepID=A0ABS5Z912_9GAMM|nr:4-hydroxythreonine-4-phosphate dehydrogenase PdxA [Zooshikella harenae]MBU2710539.1 4-hydroxythreonine-4-phosphate dehydrogenase PdxA [Zooshikella harenae]
MSARTPRLIITSGEPAGIGPDLCISLINHSFPAELVVAIDPNLFAERAAQLNYPITKLITNIAINEPPTPGALKILPLKTPHPVVPGQPTPDNASYILEQLNTAISGCQQGIFSGMVTAPINKSIINEAGIAFSGHTEYLAQQTLSQQVVMMLATKDMKVALVTTHHPLRQVANLITPALLEQVIRTLNKDLTRYFGLQKPTILVCGLNPHAGENGYLGREELDIINPTLNKLKKEGLTLVGPLPADTLFTPKHLKTADVVLAMYHDQGLPVLKFHGFGKAANITLGLPIIRTSVDHGTALDLAGSGKASSGSLMTAIEYAIYMTQNKQ